MKCKVLLFLFMPLYGWSQNLVPNPSFELQDSCPPSAVGLSTCANWYSMQWTPDYMCACSDHPSNGVPDNAWGSQMALTGECYTAIGTFAFDWPDREYIAVELLSPLTIGTIYEISFNASDTEGGKISECDCASNNIGARLMMNPPWWDNNAHEGNYFEPDNFAHINYSNILDDSEEWTLISGSIVADQPYTHLVIGNFFSNQQTMFDSTSPEDCCVNYYIEDVCVVAEGDTCGDYLGMNSPELSKPEIWYASNENAIHFGGHLAEETKIITIMDLCGKSFLEPVFSTSTIFNLPSLRNGFYILSAKGENWFYSTKFIYLKK